MARIDERLLDVNAHGVLRVPAELWVAVVFLMRHWILMMVVAVIARRSKEAYTLLGGDFGWVVLAIEVPAFVMAVLLVRRRPEAGRTVRSLWPLARHLAALTAILHIAYVAWYLLHSSYWLPWPELFLASSALIDVAIVTALFRSPHLKQVFAEFPALPEASSPSNGTTSK
jgi:hypothetical protein